MDELIEYTGVLTVDKSANVKKLSRFNGRESNMEHPHSLTVNGSGNSAGGVIIK